MITFSEIIARTLTATWYEPTESTRDRSVREMKLGPHHIRHRFPFKGGITGGDIIAMNIAKTNPLLEMLKNRPKVQ